MGWPSLAAAFGLRPPRAPRTARPPGVGTAGHPGAGTAGRRGARAARRGGLAAAAVTALGVLCTGCGGQASAAGGDPYTIGLVTSQTGTASQLGVGELRGARLAVDQINRAGGVNGHRLTLRTADDQSNPAQAVLAARKMLAQVGAIIGPSVAGSCNAVAPLATSGHRIDYCLSPGIRPAPGSTTWSSSADTRALAERLVGYWHRRGITRIGLLTTTDASGIDGARAVHEAVANEPGMRLTGAAGYDPNAISVTPQLQVAGGGHPQALVVWASGAAAGVAFKGLAQSGSTLPVATTDANLTFTFMQRIAEYAPKTLLIPATRDFWADQAGGGDAADLVRSYQTAYRHRFREQPDFGPGVAYDAVHLFAQALHSAKGDPEEAVTELSRTSAYQGVLGTYSFAPSDHRGLGADDVAVVRATAKGFTYAGR
ncbi:ABC transporter substrate-binding protein [Streptomyces sulfonofaciens]|uniref:ABC transporter substrate-binding protein n=1 Tax=Streptomyces sulfonofaciens TaxID=68272 RepID=A0A919GGB0_9ACTN|nr:ABC transporter substrate-binding protein [Streptomyces sulfonofaciens]GHH84203.1 ABC transporter substrate-binding protein [Streptomyces sulfonofaciens]